MEVEQTMMKQAMNTTAAFILKTLKFEHICGGFLLP